MGRASDCVKWLLFFFNVLFVLLGTTILSIGIWMKLSWSVHPDIADNLNKMMIAFIVTGVIIFLISLFGCCGAIQESYCMLATFATCLLTILAIQIAIAIWAFVYSKNDYTGTVTTEIKNVYKNDIFDFYWQNEAKRKTVDFIQSKLTCCGVDSYTDFYGLAGPGNNSIPWSCCGNENRDFCSSKESIYRTGCIENFSKFIMGLAKMIGGILIGAGVMEVIGMIFALCLANSIKNGDRYGYNV